MAFVDRARNRRHGAPVATRVVAEELERRAVVHAMALHEDALGALDDGPPLERGLELVDALAEPLAA